MREQIEVTEDHKQIFEKEKNRILKELEEIKQMISEKKIRQEIHPVLKWGQSDSHVYIYLKLSHRFSSPGCIDVTSQPLFLINEKKILFQVECVQAT